MPVPYPQEFRDDVVRVARNREKGVTLAQMAKDFGVHEMTLSKWLRQAAVEDGEEPGVTRSESAENRELKKRIRLLEQENEVLRRAGHSIAVLFRFYAKAIHRSQERSNEQIQRALDAAEHDA
ncbi:transposase [Streptomyces sp. NPDC058228]|uniref:transposase n=1 Tax=Streptomyces sp. NPDC058228 TaxID=3346390 RepID=UPI0036E84570